MRPSSSPCDPLAVDPPPGLFDSVLAAGPVRAAVSDVAWVRALLDAESALARAQARVGVLDPATAGAIVSACTALTVDPCELGAEATASGNPVVPLVRRLRGALVPQIARHVHRGATSQDIMDTATMLVAHRALGALLDDVVAASALAAALADTHRGTLVAGRTLLQQAVPSTFGLVAAGWLTGLVAAARRLRAVRETQLAGQLGGAAGTLASLGDAGPAVVAAYCAEVGLAEPVLPWHTERSRIADLAGALGCTAGTVGKIARDIVLHAQTEVAELREAGTGGDSSTLPQKHNPIRAVAAVAAAAAAPGLVATLLATMSQEHQRAAGNWHAEWRAVRALFESAGSATHQLRSSLDGLIVDAERMRANLDLTRGAVLAERVSGVLAERLGAQQAHDVVGRAAGSDFADRLAADSSVAGYIADLGALLDPAGYTGSADILIDRALAAAR